MSIVHKLVLAAVPSLLLVCGCAGPDQTRTAGPSAAATQGAAPDTLQSEYAVGKTTKAAVVAKWGKPSGVSLDEQGRETLTYNRSHLTGKSFIPFYFGRDSYRVKFYTFTFNKEGILTAMSSNEQHY